MRDPFAPLHRDGDSALMTEAVNTLSHLCLTLYRPSEYQLKIGRICFYPDKGTVHFEGQRALPQRGLKAVVDLIHSGKAA